MKSSSNRSVPLLLITAILCINFTRFIVVAEDPENAFITDRTSRVAVVTGGNKGIGFAIVKGLCEQFDGIVYLTSRNTERGQAAVEKLKKIGLQPRFHQLDITDDYSVEIFRNYLIEKHGGLDILVNNAGLFFKENATEPFCFQASETVRVNYFGVLRVSKALFPLLRPHSRVVHISSALGHLSNIPGAELKARFSSPYLTEDDVNRLMIEFVELSVTGVHEKFGWPNDGYAVSKAGVAALARVQQKEFDADFREDLVVNAVHPGYVSTDLTDYQGDFSPERGAQTPICLALLPERTYIKGQFVWKDKTLIDWAHGVLPTPY